MFLLFLKRYLFGMLRWTLSAACLWIALIWMADGWLPVGGFALVVATALLSIPVHVHRDYRDIRQQLLLLNEARKGQGDFMPFLGVFVAKIAEKTGMPALLVEFMVRRGANRCKNGWPLTKLRSTRHCDARTEFLIANEARIGVA